VEYVLAIMAVMAVETHSPAIAGSDKNHIHCTTITGYDIYDFLKHGRPEVRAIAHL
jgi:hypothetical protein